MRTNDLVGSNPVVTCRIIQRVNALSSEALYEEALSILLASKDLVHPLLYAQKLKELRLRMRPNEPTASSNCITYALGHVFDRCLVDISDIINYLAAGSTTVTGIQRLILASLNEFSPGERSACRLITFHNYEKEGALLIEWDFIDYTVDFISGKISLTAFRKHLEYFLRCLKPVEAQPCLRDSFDTLIIMGACWIVPSFPQSHAIFSRQHNLAIASIIYDLIPFSHPDLVSADASAEFYAYIVSLLSISQLLIPISVYVAEEIKRTRPYFGKFIPNLPAVQAVPLASEIAFQKKAQHDEIDPSNSSLVEGLHECNFVLCVGSIEVRKNHISLFVAWRHMQAVLGNECPQLVVVGKHGWKADPFFEALNMSDHLSEKILVLTGVPDETLARLFNSCLFSVYPSLDEGWGLPIGESLHAGKVCVTSNVASMPEVGKDLAIYVDPRDPYDIASKCIDLVQNPALLTRLEHNIQRSLPLRGWKDYKNDLAEVITAFKEQKSFPFRTNTINNIAAPFGDTLSFYWHLGYNMKKFPLALATSNRSIHRASISRCAIVETKILAYELDGAWICGESLQVSLFLDADVDEMAMIKGQSAVIIRVILHYFCDHAVPTPAVVGTPSLRFLGGMANAETPRGYESTLCFESLEQATLHHTHFTHDCAFYDFSLPCDALCDLVKITGNASIPLTFSLCWENNNDFKISIGDQRVFNIKVKELKFDLFPGLC